MVTPSVMPVLVTATRVLLRRDICFGGAIGHGDNISNVDDIGLDVGNDDIALLIWHSEDASGEGRCNDCRTHVELMLFVKIVGILVSLLDHRPSNDWYLLRDELDHAAFAKCWEVM